MAGISAVSDQLSTGTVVALPDGIEPHSMIALGHPAEERPPMDRYDASFIHVDRW